MNNFEEYINNIKEKVRKLITDTDMLKGTTKVYVATSGGADSMALLAYLHRYADIQVYAVHVNHGIRGETADRDMEFVKDFCDKNDIECIVFDASRDGTVIPKNASEEWARNLRYKYLDKLVSNSSKVAIAHTLSDQAETILFRLARGCGLEGLSGIKPIRNGYIRPFLGLTRSEIEALTKFYNTGYITDETNLTDTYNRNKIRHNVIPVLKEINPNMEKSIGKVCERVGKAYHYIESVARGALRSAEIIPGVRYETSAFICNDEVIQEEMIMQVLKTCDALSEQYVEQFKSALKKVERCACSGFDYIVDVIYTGVSADIIIKRYSVTIKRQSTFKQGPLHLGDNVIDYFGYGVRVTKMTYDEFVKTCTDRYSLCDYADASKLDIDNVTLRTRYTGDKFKPACRVKSKIVKFMRNIDEIDRGSVPIVSIGDNIIWLWGQGFTDGYTPEKGTEYVYKFESINTKMIIEQV